MSYSSIKVKELVEHAVGHDWSVPEFQRGFVWKSTQVRDLAESLFRRFPVGSLLLWKSNADVTARSATDGRMPNTWVVDGQQRTTALCLLFGRKPYWWVDADYWNQTVQKYDIRFDVCSEAESPFLVANAAIRRAHSKRYLKLQELLNWDLEGEDNKKAQSLARELQSEGLDDTRDAMDYFSLMREVWERLRGGELVAVSVDNELEDVVQIFERLNGRGTRVTEADIYLGVVAARPGNAGWVSEHFLPFLKNELTPAGFGVNPNLVFRTVTAVGAHRVRYKYIEDSFWNHQSISTHWETTVKSWRRTIKLLNEFGVASVDLLPSNNALVPVVAALAKFPDMPSRPLFGWLLWASTYGRFSTSSDTTLEDDLRRIAEATSAKEALEMLWDGLRVKGQTDPFQAEEFLSDYADRSDLRLMIYLLAYQNQAKDWNENGERLGFEGAAVLRAFRPQWHHIFPRKYLENGAPNIPTKLIDAAANIAVIGPTINIRISDQAPLNYITRYQISSEKLKAQLINDDITSVEVGDYEAWLNKRAQLLADASNAYLKALE